MADDDLDATKRLPETAARLRALGRLNRLVSSSLAYEEVLGAIARAAAGIMATPSVSLWVVDGESQTIRIEAWSDPEMGRDFPTRVRRFGEGAIGRIAAIGLPVHVPDVSARTRSSPRVTGGAGISSQASMACRSATVTR